MSGLGRPLVFGRSPEPGRNPGWERLSEAPTGSKLSLWILGTVSGPAGGHPGPSNATDGGLGRTQELGRRLYACALARPGFVPLSFAPVELHLVAPAARSTRWLGSDIGDMKNMYWVNDFFMFFFHFKTHSRLTTM